MGTTASRDGMVKASRSFACRSASAVRGREVFGKPRTLGLAEEEWGSDEAVLSAERVYGSRRTVQRRCWGAVAAWRRRNGQDVGAGCSTLTEGRGLRVCWRRVYGCPPAASSVYGWTVTDRCAAPSTQRSAPVLAQVCYVGTGPGMLCFERLGVRRTAAWRTGLSHTWTCHVPSRNVAADDKIK